MGVLAFCRGAFFVAILGSFIISLIVPLYTIFALRHPFTFCNALTLPHK